MRLAALLLLLALTACAGKPSRYYVLSAAMPPPTNGMRSIGTLGVGPIDVPDYLDRGQLVERVGPTEVRFVERALWGEPLRLGIIRVLTEDLQALLGAERIVSYPWPAANAPSVAVSLDVLRFERQPGDAVELATRWTAWHPRSGDRRILHESTCREPVASHATADAVEAMSRCLARLATDIVAAAEPDR